jgi:hypothetical protein
MWSSAAVGSNSSTASTVNALDVSARLWKPEPELYDGYIKIINDDVDDHDAHDLDHHHHDLDLKGVSISLF